MPPSGTAAAGGEQQQQEQEGEEVKAGEGAGAGSTGGPLSSKTLVKVGHGYYHTSECEQVRGLGVGPRRGGWGRLGPGGGGGQKFWLGH